MPRVSRSNPHYKDTAEAVPVGGPGKVPTQKKVKEAGPEIPSLKGKKVPGRVPAQNKVPEADPESPARGKQVMP